MKFRSVAPTIDLSESAVPDVPEVVDGDSVWLVLDLLVAFVSPVLVVLCDDVLLF